MNETIKESIELVGEDSVIQINNEYEENKESNAQSLDNLSTQICSSTSEINPLYRSEMDIPITIRSD